MHEYLKHLRVEDNGRGFCKFHVSLFDGKLCVETFELAQKIQLSSYNSSVWGSRQVMTDSEIAHKNLS